MPRTIQQILDQQDELADKFEKVDPDLAQERPIEAHPAARQQRISGARLAIGVRARPRATHRGRKLRPLKCIRAATPRPGGSRYLGPRGDVP